MPRSERPISRWISTVRPSGRPRETSRCLRSPVEAGGIPYSAVSQPRPAPVSHLGTLSTIDAVQITRVSPIENSAEPVAGRTKPGSIVTGRSSSAARPSRRRMVTLRLPPVGALDADPGHPARGNRSASLRSRGDPGGQLHVDDFAERHLEEPRAQRSERLDVGRAHEAVFALAVVGALEPGPGER